MKFLGPTMAMISLLREISLEDVRRKAEAGFTIGITGPSPADCDEVISSLSGLDTPTARRALRRLEWPMQGKQLEVARDIDLAIYVVPAGQDIPEAALADLRDTAKGLTPLIVVRHGSLPTSEINGQGKGLSGVFKRTANLSQIAPDEVVGQVVPLIVDLLPEHAIALGRAFSPFRRAAASKVILDTSWANAQFATFSNLPALIPVVGNLVAATADFFVLTRNQIMLLLKLAAIYGRDLRVERSIYMEIMPVVGAALLWRTIARELVDLLPGLVAAIPKVLIAFTGTYTVGQSAAYYYDQGRRPPAEVVKSFYGRATDKATTLMPDLKANLKFLPRA